MDARHILLLDDEQLTLDTLTEALVEMNLVIHTALTGQDALEILRTLPPGSVLAADVDLGTPPSGLDVAQEALRLVPGLSVVYITARPYTLEGRPFSTQERMLFKPFLPSRLIRVIDDMLATAP